MSSLERFVHENLHVKSCEINLISQISACVDSSVYFLVFFTLKGTCNKYSQITSEFQQEFLVRGSRI